MIQAPARSFAPVTALRAAVLGAAAFALASCATEFTPMLDAETAARVDRARDYVRSEYDGAEPGAGVLIMQGSDVLLAEGFGLADLESAAPITADTSFRLGSITKPFTAVAILQLVENGSVELDQPIAVYLPDLPGVLGQPTVRQLLSHTSGLPDHFALPEIPAIMRNPATPEDITGWMADADLNFEPGTRWSYSNFNYVLLGRLIEALDAQGRDYATYIEEEIFLPLGMENSHYDRQTAVIARRARGYDHDGANTINTLTAETSLAYAAGALMSSANDMALFTNALRGDQLLSDASKAEAWTAVTLPGGTSTGYGLGFNVSTFMGERVIWHNGSINGFQAAWIHMPTSDRTVAVLSNGYYRPNTTTAARRVLAEMAGQPAPLFSAQSIDDATWAQFEGRYELDDGRVLQIHVQDGVRYNIDSDGWDDLTYSGDDVFYRQDSLSHLRLRRNAERQIQGFVYHSSSLARTEGVRIDGAIEGAMRATRLDPAEAAQVAGNWLMSSGDVFAVNFDGDIMSLQLPYQATHRIYASSPRHYFMRDMPVAIEFSEDGQTASINLYGSVFELLKE